MVKKSNKMKIHIFNPEHDISLASNLERFTAPHAARKLRNDLGFLPVIWAGVDDVVIVDDLGAAKEGMRRIGLHPEGIVADSSEFPEILEYGSKNRVEVCPWGWDAPVRTELKAMGIPVEALPTMGKVNGIRLLSSRAWVAEHLLKSLRGIDMTTGEAYAFDNLESVKDFLHKHGQIVLKAPWSSSGRGVRYVSDAEDNSNNTHGLTPQLEGWINNIVLRQGCIMAEPYYNKVCDFGMEFYAHSQCEIEYRGLSLFQTVNGAYTGNILDKEDHKEMLLTRMVPQGLLHEIKAKVIETLGKEFSGKYEGPFGIDMMVVKANGSDCEDVLVNPCVEMNLRMTMGHVAIALTRKFDLEEKVMRVTYTGGRYRLTIS